MNKKLPSFQFYPGDWLKNANLRLCSKAEKGMWIDLICLAFECEERGKFMTNGTPWTLRNISDALPGGSKMNLKLIQNLVKKDVLKVDERGMFYCSRIVRDEEIRKIRSHSGELGGNPHFKEGKANPYYPPKDNQKDKQKISKQDNQKITPSSSSSSSSSRRRDLKKKRGEGELAANDAAPAEDSFASQSEGQIIPSPLDVVQNGKLPEPSTPQARFIANFTRGYEAMTGVPFKADTKHFVLVASLINRYTEPVVNRKAVVLAKMCEEKKPWFVQGGWADYTIETLSNKWNSILETVDPTWEGKFLSKLNGNQEKKYAENPALLAG